MKRSRLEDQQISRARALIRHLYGSILAWFDFGHGTTQLKVGEIIERDGTVTQRTVCQFECANGGRDQTAATMGLVADVLFASLVAHLETPELTQGQRDTILAGIKAMIGGWNYNIQAHIKHVLIHEIRKRDEDQRIGSDHLSLKKLFPSGLGQGGLSTVWRSLLLTMNGIARVQRPNAHEVHAIQQTMDLNVARRELLTCTLPAAQQMFLDALDDVARQSVLDPKNIKVCSGGNGIESYGVKEWLKNDLQGWVRTHRPDFGRPVSVVTIPDERVKPGDYVAFGAAHFKVLGGNSDAQTDADCGIIVESSGGSDMYVRMTPNGLPRYPLPYSFPPQIPMILHGVRDRRAGDPHHIKDDSSAMDMEIVCIDRQSSAAVVDRQPIPQGVRYSSIKIAVEVPRGKRNGDSFIVSGRIECDRTVTLRTQIDGLAESHHRANFMPQHVGHEIQPGYDTESATPFHRPVVPPVEDA